MDVARGINLTGKLAIVTGGYAGLGLETARTLASAGARVIVPARDISRAKRAIANVGACIEVQPMDLTDPDSIRHFSRNLLRSGLALHILINNAGNAYVYNLATDGDIYSKAVAEFTTNYFAPLRLTDKFLPLLKEQNEAAIVNVSSIVGFVPGSHLPTYSDSKAALHSHTRLLRYELAKETNIKVFELMPPLVATDFSAEIGGLENGIPASDVANDLVKALQENIYEIRVGNTGLIYDNFFAATESAFATFNN